MDEIIVFRQLTKKEVKQIADIFLRDVFKRADEKGIKIEVTEKFKDRWDAGPRVGRAHTAQVAGDCIEHNKHIKDSRINLSTPSTPHH